MFCVISEFNIELTNLLKISRLNFGHLIEYNQLNTYMRKRKCETINSFDKVKSAQGG